MGILVPADILDAEPDADLFISTDCISHEV